VGLLFLILVVLLLLLLLLSLLPVAFAFAFSLIHQEHASRKTPTLEPGGLGTRKVNGKSHATGRAFPGAPSL
jgi:hypothetical protein